MKDVSSLKADDVRVRDNAGGMPTYDSVVDGDMATYVKVSLSSKGQLGFPASVHVRDYTFKEALAFSEMKDDMDYEKLFPILQDVIKEPVDMEKITLPDIIEILMSILGTWYNQKLEGLSYYLNIDLEGDALDAPDNISKVDIPISDIVTVPLKDGICSPVTVKKGDKVLVMDVNRPWYDVVVKKELEKVYAGKDEDMTAIEMKRKNGLSTLEEDARYAEYSKSRSFDYVRYLNACKLVSWNGKVPSTLEERLALTDEVPLSFMSAYGRVLQKDFVYGVQPRVKFNCTVTGKPIERSFRFRLSRFIPSMESTGDMGFDVCFG